MMTFSDFDELHKDIDAEFHYRECVSRPFSRGMIRACREIHCGGEKGLSVGRSTLYQSSSTEILARVDDETVLTAARPLR